MKQVGVIEPISFSEWAAPIVPVLKKDGTVRICGDYKLTVNQASKVDSYPLPKIDDLFASLAGGKTFQNWIWLMPTSKFHWMTNPGKLRQSIHTRDSFNIIAFLLGYLPPHQFFSGLWRYSSKAYLVFVCT